MSERASERFLTPSLSEYNTVYTSVCVQTEKCQFRTEKCQFRIEKCHFLCVGSTLDAMSTAVDDAAVVVYSASSKLPVHP